MQGPHESASFYCVGGNGKQRKAIAVCHEEDCTGSSPFLCGDEECECEDYHAGHTTVFLKGLPKLINSQLSLHAEARSSLTAMTTILDNMLTYIGELKTEHERLAE